MNFREGLAVSRLYAHDNKDLATQDSKTTFWIHYTGEIKPASVSYFDNMKKYVLARVFITETGVLQKNLTDRGGTGIA